ncbi:hypothetical protein [Aquabacterium sp.]|uniref:hypothetical protein n=1 Tax=Aquabacterium sp. TaxID=1872578 RepID=UPI002487777C|nr:hypothetical protein [Aquabacterium sp.]MDI1261220.1 hypothetical protein [Aquabacterium sp.]
MKTKLELLEALRAFAHELEHPLTQGELKNGWTSAAQQAFTQLTNELIRKIENNEPLPKLSLSRGLDSWGVTDGALVEAAAIISNALREFKAGP